MQNLCLLPSEIINKISPHLNQREHRFSAFALLLCWLVLSLNPVQAQSFFNRHYTVEDGLPSNTVYYVMQDSDDYIWFSTDLGVSRFNGISFTNYSIPDGLPAKEIFQIREDSQKRLWFLSYNGVPSYYHQGKIHNPKNTPFLKSIQGKSFLTAFWEAPDGNIYLGYYTGELYKISRENEVEVIHLPEEIGDHIHYLWVNNNQVFGGAGLPFIRNYTKGETIRIKPNEDQARHVSRMLFEDQHLYVIHMGVLDILDDRFNQVQQVNLPEDEYNLFLSRGYYSDEIAIGTSKGLYFLNKGTYELSSAYLEGKSISYMCRDHENGWWVSTVNDGVYFAQSRDMLHYTESCIPNLPVYSFQVFKDTLWFGGSNYGFGHFVNDSLVGYDQLQESLKGLGRMRGFFEIEDQLYLRVDKRLVGRAGNLAMDTSKMKEFAVKKVFKIRPQEYLVSSSYGLCRLRIPKENSPVEQWDFASSYRYFIGSYVNSIYHLEDSLLLCSSNQGVYELNLRTNSKRLYFPETDKVQVNEVIALEGDRFLVFTYGWGVLLYSGQKLERRFDYREGDFPTVINSVKTDKAGAIWICSNSGIYSIPNPNDPEEQWQWRRLNQASGLLSDIVHDLAFYQRRVYVATRKGITVMDAAQLIPNHAPPKIASVKLDTLYSNQLFVTCDVISFANKHLFYRFSTDGENWIETSSPSFNLNLLPPGQHEIRVSARSGFSNWSEPQSINVSIRQNWWKSVWVPLMSGTFLLSLLFLAIRWKLISWNANNFRYQLNRIKGHRPEKPTITLKTSSETLKVEFDDIRYIKSEGNYCAVTLQHRKLLVLGSLKSFGEQLAESESFLRVHRSYLINANMVTSASRNEFRLQDVVIPIGATYRSAYRSFSQQYPEKVAE